MDKQKTEFALDPRRLPGGEGVLPGVPLSQRIRVTAIVAADLAAHPPRRNRLGEAIPDQQAWHRLRRVAVAQGPDGRPIELGAALQGEANAPAVELEHLTRALLQACDRRQALVEQVAALDLLSAYFVDIRSAIDAEIANERITHARFEKLAGMAAYIGGSDADGAA
jgi:hypothetical protein